MSTMSYDSENIFAKILRGQLPCHEIYRDATCLAILDVMPQSNGHILVLPFESSTDFCSLSKESLQSIIVIIQKIAQAAKEAFHADGILISQHNGLAAGQTIFHCHFHIIPCYKDIPLKTHDQNRASSEMLTMQASLIKPFIDSFSLPKF